METWERGAVAVAVAADDRFAMPAAVTLRSVAEHLPSGRKLVAHLLDCGIESPNLDRIRRSLHGLDVDLRVVRPDLTPFEGARPGGRLSIASYARLCLPDLVDGVGKVLYLDSDLVAVDDLSPLFDAAIGDHVVWAVKDPTGCGRLAAVEHLPADLTGVTPGAGYFNTGVLLIDLVRAREAGLLDRATEVLASLPEPPLLFDQDLINLALAGRIGELDLRWNAYSTLYVDFLGEPSHTDAQVRDAVASPAIIHYSLEIKPWRRKCLHPLADRWIDVVDRTAWAGYRPTMRTDPPNVRRAVRHRWNRLVERLDRGAVAVAAAVDRSGRTSPRPAVSARRPTARHLLRALLHR